MRAIDPALDATANAPLPTGQNRRGVDAIVIGAGAAGGLATLLLAESGLEVLLLDAGWTSPAAIYQRSVGLMVPFLTNLALQLAVPDMFTSFGQRALKAAGWARQPVQSKCFAWLMAPDNFVDDRDFPYTVAPGAEFDWFRTHQPGGRMVVPGHGQQYRRFHAHEFEDWPLDANELAPWYERIERRLDLSGRAEDDHCFPGGRVARPTAFTPIERDTAARLAARWPDAPAAMGRFAPPLDAPALAAATGRVTRRRGAVARHIDVDAGGHVSGVTWFDRETYSLRSAHAPVVFLCASALESTRILLSSRTPRRPDGLGAGSGALGRYVMDHVTVTADGEGPTPPGADVGPLPPGRCVCMPGFGAREHGPRAQFDLQVYRWAQLSGRARFTGVTFGEMRPRADNRVTLHPDKTDAFGNPILHVECRYDDQERAAAHRQADALRQVADALDVRLSRIDDKPAPPGTAMHECGGARMGETPETSVLDPHNQCWDARGLYVTDGAAFPSQGVNHPTLTIMALTARACAHAVRGLDSTVPSPSFGRERAG